MRKRKLIKKNFEKKGILALFLCEMVEMEISVRQCLTTGVKERKKALAGIVAVKAKSVENTANTAHCRGVLHGVQSRPGERLRMA